jgi:UDP-N-acetylglucosamine diphosphorylase / glucose-1-phosphate thymidylyltransferase / UDP-N-acetylgalactosamine diphosphorylase / glucosamine-1-phosphate N-acetyltransferase / galactosamine-1-phosphate N-acetyltransferase
MNIGLFEDAGFSRLLPLTWLRAGFELRCGRDRLVDKVRTHLGRVARVWVREALREPLDERFPLDTPEPGQGWCIVNARALVTGDVALPAPGMAWCHDGELVAAGVTAEEVERVSLETFQNAEALAAWLASFRVESPPAVVRLVTYPWDLVLANEAELRRQCRAGGIREGHIYDGAHLVHQTQIHIGSEARIKPGAVLDAEDGPIHIERDALIQANAVLEGPCYIGAGSVVRPGAAIRAGTTIGPVCKVGGEIEGSIIHGHTNKQHDGFLGHSYVGEWVNLGAGTINSDLKNTYGTIRVSLNGQGVESGQHFLGAFIGDHSKTGIGTILPTGCVIGIAANVFKSGGVPKFVPSFAWLTDAGMTSYRVDKAIQIARTVMGRRDMELTPTEEQLLRETAATAREVEAAGWV